jgi:hypothetical protein
VASHEVDRRGLMAVYVDDMRMEATVGRITARWSHLQADTPEELAAFARRLRLKRAWVQYPGEWKEHYDVTDRVRAKAIELGAVPIGYGSAESIVLMEAQMERVRQEPEADEEPPTLF